MPTLRYASVKGTPEPDDAQRDTKPDTKAHNVQNHQGIRVVPSLGGASRIGLYLPDNFPIYTRCVGCISAPHRPVITYLQSDFATAVRGNLCRPSAWENHAEDIEGTGAGVEFSACSGSPALLRPSRDPRRPRLGSVPIDPTTPAMEIKSATNTARRMSLNSLIWQPPSPRRPD